MDFNRPPQLPPEVAAQLSRVSNTIAERQDSASVNREAVPTYPDVESFLEQHAEVFSTTEEYWNDVDKASKPIGEVSGMRVMAGKEQVGDDGKIHIEYKHARGANRASQRRLERRADGVKPQRIIEDMNRVAYEHVAAQVSKGLLTSLPGSYRLRDIADDMVGFTLEGSDRSEGVSERMVQIEGEATDDMISRSEPLVDGFMRAFLGQYVGIYHIQALLADDRHVLPFVNRLQELAVLSGRGSVEFPGLLETVEAHMAESHFNKRENIVQAALHRVSGVLFSRHAFVSAIVDPESGATLPPGHNFSKEFMGSLETAQAIAPVLAENAAIAPPDITNYIVDDFDQMPEVWHVAYESIRNRALSHMQDNLIAALRPFYRSGRLPFTQDLSRGKANETAGKSAGRGRSKHKHFSMSQLSRDPLDFVSEAAPGPTTFAVLRGVDSDNRRAFTLERAASIDDLMQTTMITNLLQQQPQLADDLKALLRIIVNDPYGASKPLPDRRWARIKDVGVENVIYPIRQFSPSKASVENITEPVSRVRLSFTVSVVDNRRCIALEGVSISDAEMS